MVTLTVIKIDGKTRANWSTPFDSRFVRNLRPLDRTNISTDAVFEYEVAPNQYQTFQVSENCDTVAASFTADDQEQGAELQSNKDASGGYAGLTLLKINFKNVLNTFTSFFTNSNTAARTYTFQDRDGTVADDTDLALKAPLANPTFTGNPVAPTQAVGNSSTRIATTAFVAGEFGAKFAKIASGALTAGVRTVNDAAIQATSIVTVQRIVTGGTAAVGGYKVTINAGVSVVITALQVDCVTTETSCTDTVMALIHY